MYFNQDEIESKGAMVFDYGDLICDPGRRNILYYWLNFTASEQQCTFWFQHVVKHSCCTFSINIYLGFIVLKIVDYNIQMWEGHLVCSAVSWIIFGSIFWFLVIIIIIFGFLSNFLCFFTHLSFFASTYIHYLIIKYHS